MLQIPSPILIYGDLYLSRNTLVSIKKKCVGASWVVKSMAKDSLDEIRMEACLTDLEENDRVLVVQDIPNKKGSREFVLDLANSCSPTTKLVIWDSENHIEVDPKTKLLDKTWQEFIDAFKQIKGFKILDNGTKFTEKEDDCPTFVTKCFARFNKTIDPKDIKLLVNIVGYDRGLLYSDIKKLCINCPDKIDSKFILENAFPSNKEAVLYKLNNVVDSGSYKDSINMLEEYLSMDVNANVIAEVFVKKARWQMATVHLWSAGLSWDSIPNKLMEMGKFPSSIWHNEDLISQEKQQEAEQYQGAESIFAYMVKKQGIPSDYFKLPKEEKKKAKGVMTRKGSEILPFYFIAQQTVDFVREKIVGKNTNKQKVLDDVMNTYLFCQGKLAEIRYGDNPSICLQEMIGKLIA